MPFVFLLALGVFSVVILWCVNVDKSRVECRRYLEEEAVRVYELQVASRSDVGGVDGGGGTGGDKRGEVRVIT